jgi:hypothetical protein
MANTFKNATKSDLVTDAISNTTTNVLSAAGNATLILLSSLLSNKTGSSVTVDVYLVTATGDDVYLIRNAPVPAGSTLELITNSKIIIESSDVIRARCNTATAVDMIVSYLEQTP